METTLFDRAFTVAHNLFHVSERTACEFGWFMVQQVAECGITLTLLDLADWFEGWCSEDAVEAELVAV
jgi:hypothetical protein